MSEEESWKAGPFPVGKLGFTYETVLEKLEQAEDREARIAAIDWLIERLNEERTKIEEG